ncbi:MAG: CocE/NonD family hydrolase [Candidatus Dormibacteria bacterium]
MGTAATPARAAGDDRLGQNGPYAFTTRDFQLPVADPDDMGNPITLDARVEVPVGAGPFAGLLINHGYLGDKSSDGDTADAAARRGYIVLRYSSRGFGATLGQVDLVGAKETADMITAIKWLNNPANVPIWADHIAHYGGSYGGAHDFALAINQDPIVGQAVRALVGAATWTDLYDGLLPHSVLKISYETGFYAAGRQRTDGYNNYATEVDVMEAKVASGADLDGVHALLRQHSITGKWDRVHTPTFLVQGINDGLFDGNQAIQNYTELHNRGVPVRLYLGGIGHPPARGSGGAEIAHVGDEVNAWLDHYVRGIDNGIDRAAPIEFAETQYFNNDTEHPHTHAAAAFPLGNEHIVHLCPGTPGQGTLSDAVCPGTMPTLLSAGTGGQPTSEPVVGARVSDGYKAQFGQDFPSAATPVDVVNFDGPPLLTDTLYAGVPTLRLSVVSDPPTTGAGGPTPPSAAYQIDPKIYDVAPDTTARLITRGAFAEQPGEGSPGVHTASFDPWAFAWKFPAGHHVRLSLSSADAAYLKPNPTAFQVAVLTGSTMNLPGSESSVAPVFPDLPPAVIVPEVPSPLLLPLAAVLVGGLLQAGRRRKGRAR